jgi:hypothetical protein
MDAEQLPKVRKVVNAYARPGSPDRFQYLWDDGEYHEVPVVQIDEPPGMENVP